ncbi:MAG: flippase-like domain-containing protein, partial [Lachnospiraceae bacterium]|nr:flippase-like domain-containing protein [Lachnospiraceae bacterium]
LLVNIVNFVNSIHELKKYDKHINDINKVMKNYREGAAYILKHRKVFYMVLISTFLQRTCRFAVTYAVYRAFGLSGTSFAWIILLQAIVNVSADMIPIPGAVGVSENCYLNAFSEVFGKKLVLPSMVLSRGISFYGLVLLSGVLVVFLQLKSVAEVKGEK